MQPGDIIFLQLAHLEVLSSSHFRIVREMMLDNLAFILSVSQRASNVAWDNTISNKVAGSVKEDGESKYLTLEVREIC
jgi:hypothetical protein